MYFAACGVRLAIVITPSPTYGEAQVIYQLLVFRVQGNMLVPDASVRPAGGRCFHARLLLLSADGRHCAAITGAWDGDNLAGLHLATVHLRSATLHAFPLLGDCIV